MPAYGTSTVPSPELCLTEEKWNPSLPEQIINDQTGKWFQLVNFVVICELVDIFGVVANIINIICICKQGFKDSVNISLLGRKLDYSEDYNLTHKFVDRFCMMTE